MPQREIDSPSSNGAQLVASLLARIDGLMAQIAARDDRIDELLAQVKALNARIAAPEAKGGGPPKTPDNSSLPPSRGQKANAETPAVKRRRKGRPGVARKLAEKPHAARRFFAEPCACGARASRASWPRNPTRRDASSLSTVPVAPCSAKPDRNSRRSTIILTFRRSGRSRRASSCSAPPAPAARRG